jgi:glycosyltransferase involved in cell wall biosynthesis
MTSATGGERINIVKLLSWVWQDPSRKAFFAVLNPHDRRKNTAKIIRAFAALRHAWPNAILILKLSCPETAETVQRKVFGGVVLHDSHSLDAEGVYFTTDFIPEDLKYDLLGLFHFYVCASRAEGQNLPLQEAMAMGLVPISVNNTAMADYISADNAFVIPSVPAEVTPLENWDDTQWRLQWHETTERQILEGLHAAMATGTADLQRKRRQAVATVQAHYTFPAVLPVVLAAAEQIPLRLREQTAV